MKPVIVPLDAQGVPDLQLFIRACGTRYASSAGEGYDPTRHGGYQHVGPDDWAAWDAAVARWQIERRAWSQSPSQNHQFSTPANFAISGQKLGVSRPEMGDFTPCHRITYPADTIDITNDFATAGDEPSPQHTLFGCRGHKFGAQNRPWKPHQARPQIAPA